MLLKCVEGGYVLVSDYETEYLYEGKSYCEDCYWAVKKLETNLKTKFLFSVFSKCSKPLGLFEEDA